MRTSTRPRTRVLLALAFATARGVTLWGVAAYAALWLLIGVVAQFSMSALGLRFAPPGSSSLDTVAVVFMLLPAAALASSTVSRATELEAVRARPILRAQSLWMLVVLGAGSIGPWATSFALPQAVDRISYVAAWCIVFASVLIVGAISTVMVASMCTMGLIAAFSTPGLVPWEYNLMYNVTASRAAALLGIVLLLVGGCLQVVRHR
ncbi:hypothetical protein [Micromonospora echinofusca]|uniref:Uncharacterized protein n=1 Tax=Micromonospora echinofusca TaxID=47858 RepID=A0ABS3VZN9_MICEH|nr:hypothetical protein [Micromonospora echinofusca]MBO4210005.1 hypothetical protein [Micromonospora echinofusca]